VVDEALADQLLGRAEEQGLELLGPDGLLSQVTKAVLERALAEEMTEPSVMTSTIRPGAGRGTLAMGPPRRGC
jgi:putative transposase